MKDKLIQKMKDLIEDLEKLVRLCEAPQYHEIMKAKEIQKKIVEMCKSEISALEQQEKEPKEAVNKQQYVVGFMFTEDCKRVVLIRKKKPAWQAGLLNGVGGKIEPDESPVNAMTREYKEEAGMIFYQWNNFLTVEYESCIVYFFKAFSDGCFYQSETKETEVIEKIILNQFPSNEVIPNLNWIINLALDPDINYTKASEVEQSAPTVRENPADILVAALEVIANGDPVSVGLDEITDVAQNALSVYYLSQKHPEK